MLGLSSQRSSHSSFSGIGNKRWKVEASTKGVKNQLKVEDHEERLKKRIE